MNLRLPEFRSLLPRLRRRRRMTATPRCKARTRLGSCPTPSGRLRLVSRVSFVASSRRFPYRMFVRCWWVSRHEGNGAFTIAISHFLQSLLMTRVFWPSGLRVMRALELRTSRGFKGIKAARVDDRTSTEQQHLLPASTFGAEGGAEGLRTRTSSLRM